MDALQTAKSRNASTAASFSNDAPAAEEGEAHGVEEFALMIWTFVNSSGQLVQDVDTEVICNARDFCFSLASRARRGGRFASLLPPFS